MFCPIDIAVLYISLGFFVHIETSNLSLLLTAFISKPASAKNCELYESGVLFKIPTIL